MLFRAIKCLFQSPRDTCISLYHEAKRRRPGKEEQDYLKLILLTKPPFDYQHDGVIDTVLREHDNIEVLADFVVEFGGQRSMWDARQRNLSMTHTKEKLEARNNHFFVEFWS